jgi:hypothetical protein
MSFILPYFEKKSIEMTKNLGLMALAERLFPE